MMLLTPFAFAATMVQVYSSGPAASSFLKTNPADTTYHPFYAVDGNPATAWVEGQEGDGIGEQMSIPTAPITNAQAITLKIANGYQKSETLRTANASIEKLKVTLKYRGNPTASMQVTLLNQTGTQPIPLEVSGISFDEVVLEIASVYPGTRYKDTCLSEVEIWVDDTAGVAGENKAFSGYIADWVKEQEQIAAQFKNLPESYPLASTGMASNEDYTDLTQEAFASILGGLDAVMKRIEGTKTRYMPTFKSKYSTPVGGEGSIANVMGWLLRDNVALFETTKTTARTYSGNDAWKMETDWEGTAKVEWYDAEKTRAHYAVYPYRFTMSEREVMTYTGTRLVEWDENGKLVSYFEQAHVKEDCDNNTIQHLHRPVWENGKVKSVKMYNSYLGCGSYTASQWTAGF